MNIIEQTLNSPFELSDILYILIAFVIWFILWHLIISKLFKKYTIIYELMDYGPILAPIASFGILLFFSVIAILFIASIQVVLTIGAKMIFPLLIFGGGIITFFVFLIRHIKK